MLWFERGEAIRQRVSLMGLDLKPDAETCLFRSQNGVVVVGLFAVGLVYDNGL